MHYFNRVIVRKAIFVSMTLLLCVSHLSSELILSAYNKHENICFSLAPLLRNVLHADIPDIILKNHPALNNEVASLLFESTPYEARQIVFDILEQTSGWSITAINSLILIILDPNIGDSILEYIISNIKLTGLPNILERLNSASTNRQRVGPFIELALPQIQHSLHMESIARGLLQRPTAQNRYSMVLSQSPEAKNLRKKIYQSQIKGLSLPITDMAETLTDWDGVAVHNNEAYIFEIKIADFSSAETQRSLQYEYGHDKSIERLRSLPMSLLLLGLSI